MQKNSANYSVLIHLDVEQMDSIYNNVMVKYGDRALVVRRAFVGYCDVSE